MNCYGRTTVVVAVALVLASAVWAEQRQLTDLSLGYVKIADGDGGRINLEARCVPTADLLKQLAERTGLPANFDVPCHTYVSIWYPGKYATAEEWMPLVAIAGARLQCRKEAAGWRLFQIAGDKAYDCALTPEQLRAQVVSG